MSKCTDLVVCGWSGFPFCLFRNFFLQTETLWCPLKNVEMHIPKRKSFEVYKHCNLCGICNITCFEINPIDPFQCDIIYRWVVSEERQPNLSLAKLPCHLWFSNDIRMRSWMVFGHSVKSPLLSVSLTHQPFHFSSSTLRLHPSFNF